MILEHTLFGTLDLSPQSAHSDDVFWQEAVSLHDRTVDVLLWVTDRAGCTAPLLDQLARFRHELGAFDQRARACLVTEARQPGSEVRAYIVDDLAQTDLADEAESPADNEEADDSLVLPIAQTLHLDSVGLWADGPSSSQAIFDYVIDKDRSDQILAVKFDLNGEIRCIDWES